jgi:hypothetical protein
VHHFTFALPTWARLDHPILAYELRKLPPFTLLGSDSKLHGFVTLALLTLALTPCACMCANGPAQFVLLALGWLPLIWGAPVISREIEARTWETLCATPYGAGEIALAKLSAVVYQLSPSLGALLAGQAAPLIALALALLFPMYGFVSFSTDSPMPPQTLTLEPRINGVLWVTWGAFVVLALLGVLLDYLTNAALGVLASLVARSRSAAYATAFGLRLGLNVGWVLLATLVASAASGESQNPLGLLFGSAVAGSPGWAVFAARFQPGAAILTGLTLLVAQAGLLALILGGLVWQAERMEQF